MAVGVAPGPWLRSEGATMRQSVEISTLRPTQMSVGLREVEERIVLWQEASLAERTKMREEHVVPCIRGPNHVRYIVDHHHFVLMLSRVGETAVDVRVLEDFSDVEAEEFWQVAEFYGFAHPFDPRGLRRAPQDIPTSLESLEDDPYRGLSWSVRRRGGFDKDPRPFAEFMWADFYRRRIAAVVLASDFPGSLAKALELARSTKASHLPGYTAAKR